MTRIAFISTQEGLPWGGSEELWSQSAHHMLSRGAFVCANVKWWPTPVPQLTALEQAGCKITRRHLTGLSVRIMRKIAPQHVFNWLDNTKPNCVIISQGDPFNGVEWMQACASRRIPYVVIIQAAAEFWWPNDRLIHHATEGYRRAARCFFVAEGNVELVRKQLANPLLNAMVIRNPFNVPYDVTVPWPTDKIVSLACIGRLDPHVKGQDILFDVLRTQKWRDRDLRVTLYGDGHNRTALAALRDMYGLKNVAFGGFISDIPSLWAKHHALVLPSRAEGLPLVIVEAMLCARPCIITNVGGNAELLEDNLTGFVASGPTAPLLDEAMERAWARRGEWQQMGLTAATRVRQLIPQDPAAVFANILIELLDD